MRKALVIGGILAVVVIGTAFFALMDVNQFRPQIEAQLQNRLGRQVTMGNIGLKLIPFSIRVDNVSIAESPSFHSSQPFVTAREVDVKAALLPLLRKRVDIKSLVLRDPSIELIKSPQGVWNYSTLGNNSSRPQTGSQSGGLSLADLEIVNGRAAVTNLQAHEPRAVYDHIDLNLRGFAPGKKFDVEVAIHLPGKGSETISLKGSGGPLPPEGITAADFDGRLSLRDVSVGALRSFLGSGASDMDAVASGETDLHARNGTLNASGSLILTNVRSGSTSLSYPVSIDYRASEDFAHSTLHLASLNAKARDMQMHATATANYASTPAAINGSGTLHNVSIPLAAFTQPLTVRRAAFRINRDTAVIENLESALGGTVLRGGITVRNFSFPNLQFNADINQLNVAEVEKLSAPSKSTASHGPNPLAKITGKGTLTIGTLQYNDLVLNHVRSDCTLDRGVIRLDPLESDVSGGRETGSIVVDTRPAHPTFAVNMKLQKVDANQLLSSATSLKNVLYGLLAGQANTTFTSVPGQEVARTLNGNVQIDLSNGKLQGVDLINQMALLGKMLAGSKATQAFTNVVRLAGNMNITNGLAQTNDLRLDIEGGSVSAAGSVNLVSQALDLRLTTVFGRDPSQRLGGTQVGGLMNTVLANSNGELVIPAVVTGTMSAPRFAPDVQRIAQMKLKNLLPTTGNPGSLTSGILGALQGKGLGGLAGAATRQPAEGNASATQQKPLDSLLGILQNKTQKQQQQQQPPK
jgi:AsmA protein